MPDGRALPGCPACGTPDRRCRPIRGDPRESCSAASGAAARFGWAPASRPAGSGISGLAAIPRTRLYATLAASPASAPLRGRRPGSASARSPAGANASMPCEAFHLQVVALIERDAGGFVGAEILAPFLVGRFIGHPQAVLRIVGDGAARFEILARRHGHGRVHLNRFAFPHAGGGSRRRNRPCRRCPRRRRLRRSARPRWPDPNRSPARRKPSAPALKLSPFCTAARISRLPLRKPCQATQTRPFESVAATGFTSVPGSLVNRCGAEQAAPLRAASETDA